MLSGMYLLLISHLSPARTVSTERHSIREAAPCWSNFRTMSWCQGKFPKEDNIALLSVFCLFPSLYCLKLTHKKEVNKQVKLSYGFQFVSRGEKMRGLLVASYTREPYALRKGENLLCQPGTSLPGTSCLRNETHCFLPQVQVVKIHSLSKQAPSVVILKWH